MSSEIPRRTMEKAIMGRVRQLHCGVCGTLKENTGKKLVCRPCSRKRSADWQKANPDQANARNRRYKQNNKEKVTRSSRESKLKINYNITMDQYELMYQEQNGLCAICSNPETRKHRDGTVWSLSVDHDHVTGAIRRLLCGACNVGIENFKENPATLRAAANYLEGFNEIYV